MRLHIGRISTASAGLLGGPDRGWRGDDGRERSLPQATSLSRRGRGQTCGRSSAERHLSLTAQILPVSKQTRLFRTHRVLLGAMAEQVGVECPDYVSAAGQNQLVGPLVARGDLVDSEYGHNSRAHGRSQPLS